MDYIISKEKRKQKIKKTKTSNGISILTIHNQKLEEFRDLYEIKLPQLHNRLTDHNLSKQEFLEISTEIHDISVKKKENDYLLDTLPIINRYITLDCDGDGEGNCEASKEEKMYLVNSYYNKIGMPLPTTYTTQFKLNIESCPICKSQDSIKETEEYYTCINCGHVLNDIVICKKYIYKEITETHNMVYKVDYKRINYFIEWLNQIQAKENKNIPYDIIDKVILEIKKEKIRNVSKLTPEIIRRILRKIGESKYYEHIPGIIHSINGLPPLCIPEQIEDKVKFMFNELQEPFEKFKPQDRKNFFSYPFTFHKCMQILGINEYLKYFPLLKSREKLYKQDIIWKKIMIHLQQNPNPKGKYKIEWRFIPSV